MFNLVYLSEKKIYLNVDSIDYIAPKIIYAAPQNIRLLEITLRSSFHFTILDTPENRVKIHKALTE